MIEHDDVSFASFGKAFQEKILQSLLSDETWASQMMEVLKSSYFEKDYLKYLFDLYSGYHTRYKCFPTLQLLVTMAQDDLKEGKDAVLCHTVVNYITRMKSDPDIHDLPYVKDRSLNFCKNQALKDALEQAVDLIQAEKYETIVDVVKKAITVGTPNSTGYDFAEDIEARFVREDRVIVPTGLAQLDDKHILNGGLGKGELAVIVAPTGVGKSHFLVQMGANALRTGRNVLHYTMELREHAVAIRYDSNLCKISSTDVPESKDLVFNEYKKYEEDAPLGRLIIKEYPTSTASVLTLRSHIEKLAITKNFKPDVIIIDYADIMRSTRQFDSLRHELKLVYEELRGLGMELNVPIWTASQSNRDSSDSDVVGLDKISESFAKAMVCDLVVTLSRKQMAKSTGLGNLFVAKNRLGKDGIVFPVKLNTAQSSLEILDGNIDLDEYTKNYESDAKTAMKEKWNEVAQEKYIRLQKAT